MVFVLKLFYEYDLDLIMLVKYELAGNDLLLFVEHKTKISERFREIKHTDKKTTHAALKPYMYNIGPFDFFRSILCTFRGNFWCQT